MAKTKAQKTKVVQEGAESLKASNVAVVADFTGLGVNDINTLRKSLKAAGLRFGVIKKRILALIFKNAGIEFNTKEFPGQTGVVFSSKDIVETSAEIYKFSKQKELFKVLGGFDLESKAFVSASDIRRYGALPSREVLLGQLVFMLTSPIRSLLFVFNEKAKKG